jgi:uncharacterized protein (DUF2062 family)
MDGKIWNDAFKALFIGGAIVGGVVVAAIIVVVRVFSDHVSVGVR